MKRIALLSIFIILLVAIFSIQYYSYNMSFKEISTSLGVFVAFCGGLFYVWQKVFFPLLNKGDQWVSYMKSLFESVEMISEEYNLITVLLLKILLIESILSFQLLKQKFQYQMTTEADHSLNVIKMVLI